MTGDPWRPDAVAICVPVRDEAVLLPAMLDAVARQSLAVPITLCLLFDACTDASEAIVAGRAATLPFAVVTERLASGGEPDAGRARAAALALGEAAVAGRRAALLTTDADTRPALDWVAAAIAGLGVADVVAGHITRDDTHRDPMQDRVEAYYDGLFALRRALDPVPWEAARTHHYTGGANLAFRAEAYAAAGRFGARRAGEDAAIVDAAHRAGLRVRRDAAVRVETSSRRVGRAIGGLADHLREMSGDTVRMAHPDDAAWQYRGHAAARRAFADIADPAVARDLAERIGRDVATLRDTARSSPNAEAFALRIVPGAPGGERLIGLAQAEQALAALSTLPCERAA